jgi:hypothetical protein
MLLLASGSAIYALTRPGRGLLQVLAFGWATGIGLLYVVGGVTVRSQSLARLLPFALPLVAIALLFVLGRLLQRPLRSLRLPAPTISRDPIAWALIGYLGLVAGLLLVIVLTVPIFDSDAMMPERWMGLAMGIERMGWRAPDLPRHVDPLGPSLVPLWIAAFTPRWFDGLVGLPWWMTWVAILTASAAFLTEQTGSLRIGLGFAVVQSTLPLMATHVARPGYSELFLTLFFLCAMLHAWRWIEGRDRADLAWTIVFAAAAAGTKLEATIWMSWLLMATLLVHACRWRGVAALKLAGVQAAALGVVYALYFATADWALAHVQNKTRPMFVRVFEPAALIAFFDAMFIKTGFNLYWWLLIPGIFYLLVAPGEPWRRLLAWQVVLLLGGLIYFCCFTGQVAGTIGGYDQARFLMHLSGVGVLIVALVERTLRPAPATALAPMTALTAAPVEARVVAPVTASTAELTAAPTTAVAAKRRSRRRRG